MVLKNKPLPEPPVVVSGGLLPDPVLPDLMGLIDLFGDEENFKAVLSSQRVELVTFKPVDLKSPTPPEFIEDGSVLLNDENAAAVRALLTSDWSYDWPGYTSECIPVYAFRLKFRSKERVVSVDFCFQCGDLRVMQNGKQVSEISFQRIRNELVEIINRYHKDTLKRR